MSEDQASQANHASQSDFISTRSPSPTELLLLEGLPLHRLHPPLPSSTCKLPNFSNPSVRRLVFGSINFQKFSRGDFLLRVKKMTEKWGEASSI